MKIGLGPVQTQAQLPDGRSDLGLPTHYFAGVTELVFYQTGIANVFHATNATITYNLARSGTCEELVVQGDDLVSGYQFQFLQNTVSDFTPGSIHAYATCDLYLDYTAGPDTPYTGVNSPAGPFGTKCGYGLPG